MWMFLKILYWVNMNTSVAYATDVIEVVIRFAGQTKYLYNLQIFVSKFY